MTPVARTMSCLILTPATRFGSWRWFERVIEATNDVHWWVVSYGRPKNPPLNSRYLSLPAVDYGRLGRTMAVRGLAFANILYYLPLVPLVLFAAVRRRPGVFVGNGIVSTAMLLPIARAFRGRVFLAYHGFSGHYSGRIRSLASFMLRRCDGAFVNSRTSLDDLARLMPREKISLVPLWADRRFFDVPLEREPHEPIRLLFVGRLDQEKFAQCDRVGRRLASEGRIELWIVGDGPLAPATAEHGVRWFGYVEDPQELAEIYAESDVLWAPADETYVSFPGVEALAAGMPLIIGDVPAVDARAQTGARVPRDLLPREITEIVDGVDDGEAISVLVRHATDGISLSMRSAARAYARRHFSEENVEPVTRVFS